MKPPLSPETARLAARMMVLRDELTAVLRGCHDRSLPCVPLRGLALGEKLYGTDGLRPTGDIDLLVRRQDLGTIASLLTGLGYVSMEHRTGFAESFSYTLEFVKDRYGWVIVEPHWTLAYPPFTHALDMDQVWSRCRKGRVADVDAWLLSDEDLLSHLCFHVLHHGGGAPLLWWRELDLLVRQAGHSFNWDTVIDMAHQSGQSFLVSDVLRRLHDQFRTPIPDSVPASLERQSSWARSTRLLVQAPHLDGREEFAQFLSLPGYREKFRYAFGLLFPSPAFMRQRYNTPTVVHLGMAYLGRLFRVGREGIRWGATLLSTTHTAKPSPLR